MSRWISRIWRGLLLAVSMGCLPAAAYAYKLITVQPADGTYCDTGLADCSDPLVLRWFRLPVTYAVNVNAAADAGSPGLTQPEILSACQAAHQAWEDAPTSFITFRNDGETTQRLDPTPAWMGGSNTTLFYNSTLDAGDCVDGFMGAFGGIIAVTIFTEVATTGEIVDSDVMVDSADVWDLTTACPVVVKDIQSDMTHEYGHSIGVNHTDLPFGPIATLPTMYAFYFCDAGIASMRTLEADDKDAAACLYPEAPTLLLIDQTGSMGGATCRLDDAKVAANAFVDEFADNALAVATFADAPAGVCEVAERPGYQMKQTWTDLAVPLHTAINDRTACGSTPLWESMCCALADVGAGSNLLVYTDTGENNSGALPNCSTCLTYANVKAAAIPAGVPVYIVDMTLYNGCGPSPASQPPSDDLALHASSESDSLQQLAQLTGGLYFAVADSTQLTAANTAIAVHIQQYAKLRHTPPTCGIGPNPIDAVQQYTALCASPASPFNGQVITVRGRVTVKKGTFDAATQYVEDCSGGIQIFDTAAPAASVGDSVEVRGTVGSLFGEIRITNVASYVTISVPPPCPFPQNCVPPIDIPNCQEVDCCEWIGQLVTLRGYATAPVSNFRFPLCTVASGSGPTASVFRSEEHT